METEPAGSRTPHLVVVDDEAGILSSLRKIFEREGLRVTVTDSGEQALAAVRQHRAQVVLADIMMPKMNGIELLRALKTVSPATEVIMMTAFGTVEHAVECMRQGAYDFIVKPLKRAIVVRSVQRAWERQRLLHENLVLRTAVERAPEQAPIGQSEAMRATLAVAAQAAPSAATVLLTGESGTGKELLARFVHRCSDRRHAPYVPVNCAALPETLLETELFGHERGAFTGATERRMGRFERAHDGTIFLDEIGETSPAVQVRLLRVLQESEIERVGSSQTLKVDVRVVAATRRNLAQDVASGRFREDLFYRLNVIPLLIPPLRDRHGDVPLLAQHFLNHYCEKNRKALSGFSQAAYAALDAYSWPGNVRELENAIERAVVLCRSEIIGLTDLPAAVAQAGGAAADPAARADGIFVPFGMPLQAIEQEVIRQTLRRTDNDKKMTAHLLGIAARTITRKLEEMQ